MRHLDGFAPLAGVYDGFVLDLWGVIHDGVKPLPGALDCLARLSRAGKRSVLLSNAPRRASQVREQLRDLGIADTLYDGIMTSGEASHLALRDRTEPFFAKLGRRVLHLGPARDRPIIECLDFIRVDGLHRAGVLGGIHAEALHGYRARAEAEAAAWDLRPVATLPGFAW